MEQVAYPKKLTIALTDRCNLKCFICWRDEFEESQGNKGVHLDFAHLGHMDNAIRHAEMISLTGFGESFLYPQLHEVLDYIYALNKRDNLIMFISNGTALSYEHGKKLGSRLRELVVSLNAANPEAYQRDMHPEVNKLDFEGNADPRVRLEKLDGAGLSQFEKTCRKIKEFLRGLEPADRKKVRLHYVVHRHNLEEMEDFVLLARELGCSTVGFYHYMVTQESRIDYSIYFHQELFNEAFDRATRLGRLLGVTVDGTKFGIQKPTDYDKELHCTSPFDEAIVYTGGYVAPCCHAGSDNLGNAFQKGFDAIWFGHKYRKLREERHLDGCQTCNQYRTLDDVDLHFHPNVKVGARYQKIFQEMAIERKTTPPKVLVIGAGADGSRTLWSMISRLHEANGVKARIQYDYDSYAISEAALNYVTSNNDSRVRKVLAAWRSDVIVGNHLAFVMPVVREVFGPGLKVIHLKRARDTSVGALVKNAKTFPQNWGGYMPLAEAHDIVRPTARHFREMDIAEWNALGLEGQMGWYYDRAHGLIESTLDQFDNYLEVATESLDDPLTIIRIAAFIDPTWQMLAVQPVHLNATAAFDLSALKDPYDRVRLARMLCDFDLKEALASETYPIGYFVDMLSQSALARVRFCDTLYELPAGQVRLNSTAIAKLKVVKQRIDTWIDAARRRQTEDLPVADRSRPSRRIKAKHLGPEQQIWLEKLLGGFDIQKMAADETYAASFFVERLVTPHAGNPAMYAPLVGALRPISNSLRQLILDSDPRAFDQAAEVPQASIGRQDAASVSPRIEQVA
jgi:MoaA/NifB/PqqE/SkfB family radical SAM enzyme